MLNIKIKFLLTVLASICTSSILAQEQVKILSIQYFETHDRLFLAPLDSWIFKKGPVLNGEKPDLDVSSWKRFNPTQLNTDLEDKNGRVEGWFRIKIKLGESFQDMPLAISRNLWAATDVFIDGELLHSFGNTGEPYNAFNPILKYPIPVSLQVGKEYLIAVHFVDYETTLTQREIRLQPRNLQSFINLVGPAYIERVSHDIKLTHIYGAISISVSFLLFFLFWLLVFLNPLQKVFRLIAWLTTFTMMAAFGSFFNAFFEMSYPLEKLRFLFTITLQPISTIFGLLILEWVLTKNISYISKTIFSLILITNLFAHLFSISLPFGIAFTAMIVYFGYLVYTHRKTIGGAQLTIVASLVVPTIAAFVWITIHKYSLDLFYEYDKPLTSLLTLGAPLFLLVYISVRFKELLNEVSSEAEKVLKVTEEKKEILANQNVILEKQVQERTHELKNSLESLKSTQSQLIHAEKMASLGELTAGIAHEIQNPLNFVNNFSEVSRELVEEISEEIKAGNLDELKFITTDLEQNLEKINNHGQRASGIVKGMLEHSRTGSGKKELTDISKLADEYLRLSYHGLRAKDNSFSADFKTDFDETLPKVKVIAQDLGRVILNLINNAFYAVSEKTKANDANYKPIVVVSTKKLKATVEIIVQDNGHGIPKELVDKIFQPFFTTKPSGSGTGLGLSLSYDIIKAHGGEMQVESRDGEETKFIIKVPL